MCCLRLLQPRGAMLAGALLIAGAGGLAAQQTVVVRGRVTDASGATPVNGALVELWAPDGTVWNARTRDGLFTIPVIVTDATPFVLRVGAIGYRRVRDTVTVRASDGAVDRDIALTEAAICLGACAPDPEEVARAWAARTTWACGGTQAERRTARTAFLDFVADPMVRRQLGVGRPVRDDAARLRDVRTDSTCRRIGQAFARSEPDGTAARRFVVFRFGELWVVQAAGGTDGAVLGADLRRRMSWLAQ